jgi:hypothetical protein
MIRPSFCLALLLICHAPSSAEELQPFVVEVRERLLLEARLLITGPEGSVTASVDTAEIPVGEAGHLGRRVDLGAAGGEPAPVEVSLAVAGRILDEMNLELEVASEVRSEEGEPIRRFRRESLLDGGSLLVEIFVEETGPQRHLFVVLEAESDVAPYVYRKEADLRPIDLVLHVAHVKGDNSRPLKTVRMGTVSGKSVDYAFRLALPAEMVGGEAGEGLAEVGVTVRALPRRLPDGSVDLLVTLLDPRGRPWTDGEPLERSLRRTVDPGEGLSHRLISRSGGLVYSFTVTPYY